MKAPGWTPSAFRETKDHHALAGRTTKKLTRCESAVRNECYMAQKSNARKRAPLVVCPHCGEALNPDLAAKAKRVSARKIIMAGILAALDKGPASPREIEERMGVKPNGYETSSMLRVLERQRKVAIVGTRQTKSMPSFIWARVIKDSAASSDRDPQQTQAIDPQSHAHKDSKRGART